MTSGKANIFYGLLAKRLVSLLLIAAGSSMAGLGQNKNNAELQVDKCWEYGTGERAVTQLAADADNVYFVRGSSTVEAVSLATGKRLWASEVGGVIASNMVADENSLYFVRLQIAADGTPTGQATVRALSVATGITRWSSTSSPGERFSAAVGSGVLRVASHDGELRTFSTADGAQRASVRLGIQPNSRLAFAGLGLFVIDDGKNARVVRDSGETLRVGASQFALTTIEMVDDATSVLGDERGNITSYSVENDKPLWQFKSGGGVSDIVVVDGKIVAASNDNFVYALAPYNGSRIWKRRVSGRTAAVMAVGSDIILLQPLSEGNVILLAAKNGKVAGQVAIGPASTVSAAVVADTTRLILAIDNSLYGYGIGGCPIK